MINFAPMDIRTALLAVAVVSAIASARAQGSPEDFKRELGMNDPVHGSRVMVEEEAQIRPLLNREGNADVKIKGFRVRIFLDNSQGARAGAAAAQRRFKELFPDISCYLDYHELYFRVAVGDCITDDEAQMLLAKVVRDFPNAFRVQEDIPLNNFVVVPQTPDITALEPSADEQVEISDSL